MCVCVCACVSMGLRSPILSPVPSRPMQPLWQWLDSTGVCARACVYVGGCARVCMRMCGCARVNADVCVGVCAR